MEYLVGIIVALAGGVFVLWRKLQGAKVEKTLAETKGADAILKQNQEAVDKLIDNLDKGIEKMNEDRKKEKEDQKNLSLSERAKRWGK